MGIRLRRYRKASSGTNVEIADDDILPAEEFERIEVDLDQPGHTTKMVKMDDVAYVPGLSRNLLSTTKAVEQWGKPLIYYRNEAVLGFPEEESLVSDPEAGGGARRKIDEERIGEDLFGNGAGDENGGIPRRYGGPSHACAPERRHNEKDGRDDGNRDDGPVGGMRDVLPS